MHLSYRVHHISLNKSKDISVGSQLTLVARKDIPHFKFFPILFKWKPDGGWLILISFGNNGFWLQILVLLHIITDYCHRY